MAATAASTAEVTAPSMIKCVQLAWFQKWPWLHYDQVEGKMFCQAVKQRIAICSF